MKLNYKILLVFVLVIGLMVWNTMTQEGINDLKGDFEEIAAYRNENNTGPILRVYAVTVKDTLWSQMQQYGDYMLHSKLGNTKVYFFPKGVPVPKELNPGRISFPAEFNEYCLAKYEKNASGLVNFNKYPLR